MQTDRCILTEVRPGDKPRVVRLYTDARVRRYLGGPAESQTIHSQFRKMTGSTGPDRYWAIRPVHDGPLLGIISLGAHHDGEDTEVSYQLLPAFQGQGYATEAVMAVVDYALDDLGLHRIIAETQSANTASCRLLERIGMHRVKTLQRFGAEQIIYSMQRP